MSLSPRLPLLLHFFLPKTSSIFAQDQHPHLPPPSHSPTSEPGPFLAPSPAATSTSFPPEQPLLCTTSTQTCFLLHCLALPAAAQTRPAKPLTPSNPSPTAPSQLQSRTPPSLPHQHRTPHTSTSIQPTEPPCLRPPTPTEPLVSTSSFKADPKTFLGPAPSPPHQHTLHHTPAPISATSTNATQLAPHPLPTRPLAPRPAAASLQQHPPPHQRTNQQPPNRATSLTITITDTSTPHLHRTTSEPGQHQQLRPKRGPKSSRELGRGQSKTEE